MARKKGVTKGGRLEVTHLRIPPVTHSMLNTDSDYQLIGKVR